MNIPYHTIPADPINQMNRPPTSLTTKHSIWPLSNEVLTWLSDWCMCKWFAAHGPADATDIRSSLPSLNPEHIMVYLSGPDLTRMARKEAVKCC